MCTNWLHHVEQTCSVSEMRTLVCKGEREGRENSMTSKSRKENRENGKKESHCQTNAVLMHQRGHEEGWDEGKVLPHKLGTCKTNKERGMQKDKERDMQALKRCHTYNNK